MLICCQTPGGATSVAACPATRTRPSAGASTSCSAEGGNRRGSRKKKGEEQCEKRERRGGHRPHGERRDSRQHRRAANKRKTRPIDQPVTCRCAGEAEAGAKVSDDSALWLRRYLFHLIFELELAFLQRDFLELLEFREIRL